MVCYLYGLFLEIKRPPCSSEAPKTGRKTEVTAAPSVLKSLLQNSKQQTATPTVKQGMDIVQHTQDQEVVQQNFLSKGKDIHNFIQIRKILPISLKKFKHRLFYLQIHIHQYCQCVSAQYQYLHPSYQILSSQHLDKSVDMNNIKDIKQPVLIIRVTPDCQ